MKEKIGRLSRGVVESRRNRIALEPASISASVSDAEPYSGEFRIVSKNRLAFRGIVYTSDAHVVPSKIYFSGTESVISYTVKIDETISSDVIDGAFSIVSSGGELSLPYHFVINKKADRDGSPVESIRDFASYAAAESDRALEFFYSDAFRELPFMQDMNMQLLYSALSSGSTREAALDEFLVANGVKTRAYAIPANEEITFLSVPGGTQIVHLTKHGSGYLRYTVSTDSNFIKLDTTVITGEDFASNTYYLRYAIAPGRLEAGRNVGSIFLRSAASTVEVKIVVFVDDAEFSEKQNRTRLLAQYTRAHIGILTETGDRAECAFLMHEAADRLYRSGDPKLRDILRKIESLYYIGNLDEATSLLIRLSHKIKSYAVRDPEGFVYFYYLVYLVDHTEEKRTKLIELLKKYDGRDTVNAGIYLIRLLVDDLIDTNPSGVMEWLYRMFDMGVDSPYLYLAALEVYLRHPDMIKVLDRFEIQVILFGLRSGKFTLELAREAALLTRQLREFSPLLINMLVQLYRHYPEPEILTVLCAVLIRAGKKDKQYFIWYKDGVAKDLRIAGLYDNYLASMPADYTERFPNEVYYYFSYNSPVDRYSKKVLYRSILTHFGEGNSIRETYQPQISEFAAEQLLDRRIDEDLSVIYSSFLTPELVDENMADILPDILKTARIEVDDDFFKRIVICYGELVGEQSLPVSDGTVYLPLYTSRHMIFFEDRAGIRHAGVPCKVTMLMNNTDSLIRRCEMLLPDKPLSKLKDTESCLAAKKLSRDELEILIEMSKKDGLSAYYKRLMLSAVINKHDWRTSEGCTDLLLECIGRDISGEDKVSLIQALEYQGCFDESWRLTKESSYVNLPLANLLDLCIYSIDKENGAENSFILEIDKYLFKHKAYDRTTLSYLCRYYNGLTRDMLRVLKTGMKSDADVGDLPERVLAQMLFTGTGNGLDQAFDAYMKKGKAERVLIDAYYVVKCHNFFVKNEVLTDELAEKITDDLIKNNSRGYGIPVIVMLALTMYYSMQEELSEEVKPICTVMLENLIRKGIVMTHFKRLSGKISIPAEICDKTVITWCGEEGMTVALLLYRNGTSKDPVYLEMNHTYGGVYTRAVLLFGDEHPRYEIRVEKDGEQNTVEVGELYPDITRAYDELRFSELNRIVEMYNLSDRTDWQEKLKEYGEKDTLYSDIFRIG